MRQHLKRITNWYWKNERRLSSIGLISGFLFDIFTLTRVDHFLENFWIGFHLVIAAVAIIFLNLYEEGRLKSKIPGQAHFWWSFVIQFAFGGLFSVYLVFYTRSASLFASWPFLLLLAANFFANERLRAKYARTGFQMSMFFLAILFYNIYIIPIIVGSISTSVFLLSGIVSLGMMALFILLLIIITPERVKKEKRMLLFSIAGVYLLINLLYFSDLIPPIPLSLKQGGVYHFITKNENGNYSVTEETKESNWFYRYFVRRQAVHIPPGDPVYVFSAIFAPSSFSTNIVHRWQYFDENKRKWLTLTVIPLTISGGREEGYRTFSKSNPFPGLWRVNVETTQGAVIGTIKFLVEKVNVEPSLVIVER